MPAEKHKPEEIIGKLREVEIVLGQGGTAADACRRIAVSEQTVLPVAQGIWWPEVRPGSPDEGSGKGEPAAAPGDLRDPRQVDLAGGNPGKLLSPARRRRCIDQLRRELPVSERRSCRVPGQHRSTHRLGSPRGADDEQRLTEDIIARGPPAHIRSDNGAEFIATAVQDWLGQIGVKTLCITPGSPWDDPRSAIDPGDRLPEVGLQRELQRLALRRTAQWRDLLQSRRSQGADRGLASALQHHPTTQQPRLPPASPETATPEATMHQQSTRTTRWRPINGGGSGLETLLKLGVRDDEFGDRFPSVLGAERHLVKLFAAKLGSKSSRNLPTQVENARLGELVGLRHFDDYSPRLYLVAVPAGGETSVNAGFLGSGRIW